MAPVVRMLVWVVLVLMLALLRNRRRSHVAAEGLGRQPMSDGWNIVVAPIPRHGHLIIRVHLYPVVIGVCVVLGEMVILVHASRADHVVHAVCRRSVLHAILSW
jgi:hypothetical protein